MPEVTRRQRVSVYVDGFNFYYGLRQKNWKRFYWLDMVKFFESMIKPYQELIEVTYFSAKPHHNEKRERQDLFFTANKINPKFKLELGRYLPKDIKCKNCNNIHKTYEEKETDVKIATKIIGDVVKERCDISIIVSADSDLVPPIEFVRDFRPSHKIYVYFPPCRYSTNLASIAHNTKKLDGAMNIFNSCLLPSSIKLENGFEIKKPSNWK